MITMLKLLFFLLEKKDSMAKRVAKKAKIIILGVRVTASILKVSSNIRILLISDINTPNG